jgi:hypothetical protein
VGGIEYVSSEAGGDFMADFNGGNETDALPALPEGGDGEPPEEVEDGRLLSMGRWNQERRGKNLAYFDQLRKEKEDDIYLDSTSTDEFRAGKRVSSKVLTLLAPTRSRWQPL